MRSPPRILKLIFFLRYPVETNSEHVHFKNISNGSIPPPRGRGFTHIIILYETLLKVWKGDLLTTLKLEGMIWDLRMAVT